MEEGFRGGSGSGTLDDREKRETDECDEYDKMLIYLDNPTKHHRSIVPFIACAKLIISWFTNCIDVIIGEDIRNNIFES